MSHFTVLVIGDNPDEQLQPYHEFECTGEDDQHVQDVDITEEARKEYEKATETMLRTQDGALVSPYDDKGMYKPEFCGEVNDPFPRKELHVPEGYTKVEVPTREQKNFVQFVTDYYGKEPLVVGQPHGDKHKYGYVLLDQQGEVLRVVKRTNPEAKWDWYVLGGRWTGFFQLKPGRNGEVGEPGIMTGPAKPGRADRARNGDIDFEAMRDEAERSAALRYDQIHAVIAGRQIETWEQVRSKHDGNIEGARARYHAQPALVDLRKADLLPWYGIEKFLRPRDEYLAAVRRGACMTFALVKDGQWYEKGSVGWWGMVRDEKEEARWHSEFAALVDSLPDDTILSVYDCHI